MPGGNGLLNWPAGTAISRVLDHYLHTAHAAVTLTDSGPEPITLGGPQPGIVVDPPGTADDALAWFTAEYPVLLAAVQFAARTGRDPCVWRLAWALGYFLLRRGEVRAKLSDAAQPVRQG